MSTLSPPISALIAWTVICGTVIVLTNIAKVTKYIDKDNAGYVGRNICIVGTSKVLGFQLKCPFRTCEQDCRGIHDYCWDLHFYTLVSFF
jgi:hypothetical protein